MTDSNPSIHNLNRAQLVLLLSFMLFGTSCGRQTFTMPSSAMAPTIPAGSRVEVNMNAYRETGPARWDVVVFEPPPFRGQGQLWAMRVIGLPGEEIAFSGDGKVLVNGVAIKPPATLSQLSFQSHSQQGGSPAVPHPFKTPIESYYLLGDNAPNSNDSRFWGAVPRADIKGRVIKP